MEYLNINNVFGLLYLTNSIMAIIIMVRVVLGNRNPIKTFAWIMVLLFLPPLGLILYFFFGRDTKRQKYINRRSLSQILQRTHLYHRSKRATTAPPAYAQLAKYLENTSSAFLMPDNNVVVINDNAIFMEQLLAEIAAAKKHIHVQFYIFDNDTTGRRVRDALAEKAREGVEVRLIYDSVGCWRVPRSFFEEIRFAGGQTEEFLKVHFPVFGNRLNYRNHRKIVVIDGIKGFIGGCNIADRYIYGIGAGCWRDTMLAIRGSAVHGLQASFLVDWYFANGTLVSGGKYFPTAEQAGKATIQIAHSNPVGSNRIVMSALITIIATAKEYVYIQTPYLMLNDTTRLAIRNAALSGVDIRIMIPAHSDSRLSDYASGSYLGELLEAGVKIYLYEKGMMHCKVVVCDDSVSSVGSVNFDFRSFYYNFEVSAIVYDEEVAHNLKQTFMNDKKASRRLTHAMHSHRPFTRRCIESVARLLSPLM